jgi:negative regulator of flagellin synthesis FlgM
LRFFLGKNFNLKGGDMKVYNHIEGVNTDFVKKSLSKKENKSVKNTEYKNEDSVEISNQLKNIETLKQNVTDINGIRKGKVNGIKLQVENGSYKISSEDIAEKIIEESIAGK